MTCYCFEYSSWQLGKPVRWVNIKNKPVVGCIEGDVRVFVVVADDDVAIVVFVVGGFDFVVDNVCISWTI